MSRDHRKLKVFEIADALVIEVYGFSFPKEEKYGLQSQIRRAAVSVSTNIVEGCARKTTKDYLYFLRVSLASASEVRYLVELSSRLSFVTSDQAAPIVARYSDFLRALEGLIRAIGESDELKSGA